MAAQWLCPGSANAFCSPVSTRGVFLKRHFVVTRRQVCWGSCSPCSQSHSPLQGPRGWCCGRPSRFYAVPWYRGGQSTHTTWHMQRAACFTSSVGSGLSSGSHRVPSHTMWRLGPEALGRAVPGLCLFTWAETCSVAAAAWARRGEGCGPGSRVKVIALRPRVPLKACIRWQAVPAPHHQVGERRRLLHRQGGSAHTVLLTTLTQQLSFVQNNKHFISVCKLTTEHLQPQMFLIRNNRKSCSSHPPPTTPSTPPEWNPLQNLQP